jgi:AraC-like DNA-binding protein
MKQAIRKTLIPTQQLFLIRELKDKHFDPVWHFHSDYQLFWVAEGHGTRFIGDDVRRFESGELVFTGPDLPHLWRSDDEYFDRNSAAHAQGIVLYLKEDFLGIMQQEKDEFTGLKKLFEKSKRGLDIKGTTKDEVIRKMKGLLKSTGTRGIISVLEMLDCICESKELHYISHASYTNTFGENEANRMSKVYAYVMDHLRQDIRLNEIAKELCMTPTSFSRYFTMKTNQPFSRFVIGLRIQQATKLLVEDEKSIAEISWECGFKTLSHFNKQFRESMQLTPSAYRKQFKAI